jgi:cobalt-zinc-cadmium efflux system protein
MGHSHGHNHGRNHSNSYNKAFAIGISLNVVFVAVEVFYGLIANSSALLADAGHNASDVLGLVFAWFAIWMSSKKPNGRYTYGYKKTTILISVLNAFLLFGAVIAIGWDAIGKFKNPEPVAGTQVMIVAGIGVLINTITALMFLKGQKDDLNIKGAFLHMAADAGVSLGVVISGLLIVKTGLHWIDPIMSFIIIIVILWGTWKLFIESIRLALDAVPSNIKLEEVKSSILNTEGVIELHDLHLWAMSTNENALSAHVIASVSFPKNRTV